jgi:hypothetical protein
MLASARTAAAKFRALGFKPFKKEAQHDHACESPRASSGIEWLIERMPRQREQRLPQRALENRTWTEGDSVTAVAAYSGNE